MVRDIAPLQGEMDLFGLSQWLRFACHWLPSAAPAALSQMKRAKAE